MRVDVEPGVRTAAVEWEAPAKRSLALYLLLSDDRSIAGGVATIRIAAADIRSDAVAAAAAAAAAVGAATQQQKEAVVHQSARKPSERAVGVAKLCG